MPAEVFDAAYWRFAQAVDFDCGAALYFSAWSSLIARNEMCVSTTDRRHRPANQATGSMARPLYWPTPIEMAMPSTPYHGWRRRCRHGVTAVMVPRDELIMCDMARRPSGLSSAAMPSSMAKRPQAWRLMYAHERSMKTRLTTTCRTAIATAASVSLLRLFAIA